MTRRIRGMAVVVGLSLLATVAFSGAHATAKDPELFNGSIKIFRLAYYPNTAAVAPGQSVRFVNLDGKNEVPHSATAVDGSFDTGVFFGSARTIVAPATPGTYEYYCVVHPFMHGFLEVVAPPAEPPPPVEDEPAFTG